MTFEEFFKKKKINMDQLEIAEPALFAEFKTHYELMGEKSFDHTKKFWFNQLRLRFRVPEEPKVEKVKIENQIAEQTITDAVTEKTDIPVTPKLGFKPKFNTAITSTENTPITSKEETESTKTEDTPAPELGFKPKFKTASAPTENTPAAPEEKAESIKTEEAPAPKLGFKPKFKAVAAPTENTPAAPEEKVAPTKTEETSPEAGAEQAEVKPAYKPRFNMKNIKPKTEED